MDEYYYEGSTNRYGHGHGHASGPQASGSLCVLFPHIYRFRVTRAGVPGFPTLSVRDVTVFAALISVGFITPGGWA